MNLSITGQKIANLRYSKSDFWSDLGEGFNRVVGYGVEIATGGGVKYDPKNNSFDSQHFFKNNFLFHGLGEGLGEITGRNQAREQQHQADAMLREQKANAAQDLQNQRYQDYLKDFSSSNMASASRTGPGVGRGNQMFTAANISTPLGGQQDFLGL